jgi:hypothetical protein
MLQNSGIYYDQISLTAQMNYLFFSSKKFNAFDSRGQLAEMDGTSIGRRHCFIFDDTPCLNVSTKMFRGSSYILDVSSESHGKR